MKILRKLPEIVLLVILFTIISQQHAKTELCSNTLTESHSVFTLDNAQEFFPSACSVKIKSIDRASIKNKKGVTIGKMLSTSPLADDIIGYAGKVPVLIVINKHEVIVGLKLLSNYETPRFINRINKKAFFDSWNRMSVKDAITSDVDVVSGASMTTKAVKRGVQLRLSKYMEVKTLDSKTDWITILAYAASIMVIIFALLSIFYPKTFCKKRIYLLIASVLILGFWQAEFISLGLMYGWMINGIPIASKIVIFSLVILSILIPLFTNKAFYCTYVCPYGAAQELMGKLNKKKLKLPVNVFKYLRYIKMIFFYGIALAVVLRFEFDIYELEPFSAFLTNVASPSVIVLATIFLIISIFIPKAWCNYFCPTGYLLDIFRKGKL